jgi:hypothetical protein
VTLWVDERANREYPGHWLNFDGKLREAVSKRAPELVNRTDTFKGTIEVSYPSRNGEMVTKTFTRSEAIARLSGTDAYERGTVDLVEKGLEHISTMDCWD